MTDKKLVRDIPTDRLSQYLLKSGEERALAERAWDITHHQRLPVLAVMTDYIMTVDKVSHNKAEDKARYSQEYQEHLTKQGDIKQRQIEAQTRYDVIMAEIKIRINRGFEQGREYNAGRLDT